MGIERLLGVTVRIKVSSWVEQGGLRFQPYREIIQPGLEILHVIGNAIISAFHQKGGMESHLG